MRGRTLSDAFVILDEAQNTTSAQMKMFLTRLGWNSKAIVTGDITQIDLDHRHSSGLVEVQYKLKGVRGISFCYMDDTDVVRPPIVAEIIKAYERKSGKPDEAPDGARHTADG
jgi:phosphate starvation-inducible PhoH-like protein